MSVTIWWPDHYFVANPGLSNSIVMTQYVRGDSYTQFKFFRALRVYRVFSSRRVDR